MIETRKIKEITPYDKNPRKNEKAISHVLESLNRHGQVKPIVISAKGKPFGQEVICAGHTTFEALKRFGAKEVKVVVKEFVDEAQFVDYNIRDNKTSEFAEWDETILEELSSQFDIDLKAMDFEFTGNESDDHLSEEFDPYTKKVSAPIYEVTGDCPAFSEMVDSEKSDRLIKKIDELSVEGDLKDFLIKSAHRHTIFNYGKIAEYYAHADAETQGIMEDLALVVIDFNKAIEDGYIQLSEEIRIQYLEDYE